MEFRVKIYGAPYGFELYDGTEQELNYFQTFDNGSTETVKMTIHRLNNNEISYNYLRYGFVTSGGRTGSFFGLSVIFEKVYCSDYKRLYQLFNAVYGTIVKKAVLLEELTAGQWQAKYKISKFSDSENEIKRIEGVIAQNLRNALVNDIKPLAFPPSDTGNSELRLNDDVSNDVINNALNKYSVVTISTQYVNTGGSGQEISIIPYAFLTQLPQIIREIKKEDETLSNKINVFQTKFKAIKDTNGNTKQLAFEYANIVQDLRKCTGRMDKVLGGIQTYLKINPSHPLLLKSKEQISFSYEHIKGLLEALKNYENFFGEDKGGNTRGGSEGGNDGATKPSLWQIFIHKIIKIIHDSINKNKKIIISVIAIISVIIVCVLLFNSNKGVEQPGDGKPQDSITEEDINEQIKEKLRAKQDSLKEKSDEKYDKEEYVEAYNDAKEADDTTRMNDCKNAYKKICMEKACGQKDANEAIVKFTKDMNDVDYQITESDKTNIKKACDKNKVAINQGTQPETVTLDPSKLTIHVYQDKNICTGSPVEVNVGKEVTLTCKYNGKDVTNEKECKITGIPSTKFTPQKTDENFDVYYQYKTIQKSIKITVLKTKKIPGNPLR